MALGDSKVSYKHTKQAPIHGAGQGSCASPSIWLLTSSILMDYLSEFGGRMVMQDVTEETIQQWIDGFMDDMSLSANLKRTDYDTNDILQLHEKL
jgi:hypothetical protein